MPRFTPHTIAIALGIIAVSAVLFLTDDAVPGDVLFPVDRFFESVSLKFHRGQLDKAEELVAIAKERRNELEYLKKEDSFGNVTLALKETLEAVDSARQAINAIGTGEEADRLSRELWYFDNVVKDVTASIPQAGEGNLEAGQVSLPRYQR